MDKKVELLGRGTSSVETSSRRAWAVNRNGLYRNRPPQKNPSKLYVPTALTYGIDKRQMAVACRLNLGRDALRYALR